MAAYGYRTRPGVGQHDALGRFLSAIFDSAQEDPVGQHDDRMRRERNRQRYDAHPITGAAADTAARVASTLHRLARERVQPGD